MAVDIKTFKEYLSVTADIAEELGKDTEAEVLHNMAGLPTKRKVPLYRIIAQKLEAAINVEEGQYSPWGVRHRDDINDLCEEYLPSGSGIDSGVSFDSASTPDRLRFEVPYHHMNENGMYVGWMPYDVFVFPSLAHKFELEVIVDVHNRELVEEFEEEGIDVEGTIDYIADIMHEALSQKVEI